MGYKDPFIKQSVYTMEAVSECFFPTLYLVFFSTKCFSAMAAIPSTTGPTGNHGSREGFPPNKDSGYLENGPSGGPLVIEFFHPKPDEVFFFNPKQMGLPKQGYDKANSVA